MWVGIEKGKQHYCTFTSSKVTSAHNMVWHLVVCAHGAFLRSLWYVLAARPFARSSLVETPLLQLLLQLEDVSWLGKFHTVKQPKMLIMVFLSY
jgi:hypothetical protein